MITLMAMRKQLLLALLTTGACCGLAVSAIHSKAHAQDATKSCNAECLLKEIDTLDKKVDALERIVDALSTETNKSIKSGQKIILHTDPGLPGGGCLTYIGPSGDLGGFVSWNVNCSHGLPKKAFGVAGLGRVLRVRFGVNCRDGKRIAGAGCEQCEQKLLSHCH